MPVKRKPQQQIEFDIIEDQGVFCELSQESEHPQPFYEGKNGSLFLGDAIHWLKGIPSASVDLIFADPPYNIKKADWDTFDSMHAYVAWSRDWLTEASRVLKPSGTIYVCGFSEILADVKVAASHLFEGCRWLV